MRRRAAVGELAVGMIAGPTPFPKSQKRDMPTLKVAQATSPASQPSQRSYQQSSQRSTKSKAKKVKKVKKIKAHSSPGDDDEILVEAEELTELRTVAEDAAEVVTEDAPEPKEAASGVVALTAETAGMEAASEAVSAVSSIPMERQSHAAERFKPSWHRMLWSGHIQPRCNSMAVVSVS
jgi:hypothetical protein